MKRGRISVEEKQQILNDRGLGIQALVEKYQRSVDSIQQILAAPVETTTTTSTTTTGLHVYARKRGSISMTEAASDQADASYASSRISSKPYIHKMRDED